MQKPPPPFACSYSPNIPELLMQLNCTLAITTYQAGKVVFISPKNENHLVQLPRTFRKAMGMALGENRMGIACKDEVIVLSNVPDLGRAYPKQPNTYDAFYVPRSTYYTGQVDIHDLHWGDAGLWAVNTSFSTLCLIDEQFSFNPQWKPHFIDKLASEDRCHLNGLAMQDGKPKYISALGSGNTHQSWRENIVSGGIVMDIESNEIVLNQLAMPHSPRLIDGKLYLVLSATGDVICADPENGNYDVVCNLGGFVRGMAYFNDYLFVGLSRLRKNSSTFRKLEIADKAQSAGISIIHLPTGSLVGEMKYQSSVDEIYDVQILPNTIRPGILNTENDYHKMSLSIPNATFWARKNEENNS